MTVTPRPRALVLPTLGAVVVLVVALLVRSGAPHSAPAARPGTPVAVHSGHFTDVIHMFAFQPANFTVKAGTTITFHNDDQTAHTATANSNAFGTGTINPGHTGKITLTKPGTYPYHCAFHAFMTGTITVVR